MLRVKFGNLLLLALLFISYGINAIEAQAVVTTGTTGGASVTTTGATGVVVNATGAATGVAAAATASVSTPVTPPVETHGLTSTQNAWLEAALIGVYIILGCLVLGCCIGGFGWMFWNRRPNRQAMAYAQMQGQKIAAQRGQFY